MHMDRENKYSKLYDFLHANVAVEEDDDYDVAEEFVEQLKLLYDTVNKRNLEYEAMITNTAIAEMEQAKTKKEVCDILHTVCSGYVVYVYGPLYELMYRLLSDKEFLEFADLFSECLRENVMSMLKSLEK